MTNKVKGEITNPRKSLISTQPNQSKLEIGYYQQMYKSVNSNPYQVEDETEDGKFVVVQTEGCYQHRMKLMLKN